MPLLTKDICKTILYLLLVFLTASGFLALPVEKVLVTATFGESRGDHLHNGIDLGRGGQKVFPVAPGELVFYLDREEHPFLRVFGNGNLAVLQHGKKNRSYYYHLKQGSVEKKRGRLSPDDTLAVSGNSGRSFGAHLHLSWSENGVYFNPLLRFPKMKDGIAPKVPAIIFLIGNRQVTIPEEYRLTGVFKIRFAARAYDQSEQIRKVASAGVYRIAFYLDGKKMREYRFDRIVQVQGRAKLDGRYDFKQIFYRGLYTGGEYRNLVGKHVFRVQVWDRNGNTSSRSVKVNFR